MQYTLHVCGTRRVNRVTVDNMADLVRLTMGMAAAWKAVPTYGENLYHQSGEPSYKIRSASRSHIRQYQHAKRALIQRWMQKVDRSILLTRDERDEVRYALRYDSALLAIRRDVTDKLVRLGDLSLTRVQTSIYYLSPGLIEAYFAGEQIA